MTGYSSLGLQRIGVKVEQNPCRAVWTQFENVLAVLGVNSYLSPTALSEIQQRIIRHTTHTDE